MFNLFTCVRAYMSVLTRAHTHTEDHIHSGKDILGLINKKRFDSVTLREICHTVLSLE